MVAGRSCSLRAAGETHTAAAAERHQSDTAMAGSLPTVRHTNASLFLANRTDVATVSGLLDHSQANPTLDIYTYGFDAQVKEVSRALQELKRRLCPIWPEALKFVYYGFKRAVSSSTFSSGRSLRIVSQTICILTPAYP